MASDKARKPPWLVGLLDRAPLSPLLVGLLVAALLLSLYLAGEYHWGELPLVLAGDRDSLGLRATATLVVMVALTPVAHCYHRRWTRANVAALADHFSLDLPRPIPARSGWLPGMVGALILLGLFFLLPMVLRSQLPSLSFQLAVAVATGTFYGWLGGRFLTAMVIDSLSLSALAEQIGSLDLFRPELLAPFTRQGLGGVLLLALNLSVNAHLFVAPGDAAVGSVVMVTILLLTMTLIFILPAVGVHRLIRSEKDRRLELLRQRLRDAAGQIESGQAAGVDMTALLALERRLMSVREWPIDAGNWARFALYLLLGLGSWVGAAAVERLLETYVQ